MFVRKLFSESGEASWGRIASFICLGFVCGWVTYLVRKNHALPDLTSPLAFITGTYAVGKVNETIQKFSGRTPGQGGS